MWVNLGSVHLACNEPDEAARMYAAALSKFYSNQESRVLLYLARAQYDQKRVAAAKRTLLKALHICPRDHTLLFNAALTMQQFASSVRPPPFSAPPVCAREGSLCVIMLGLANNACVLQILASIGRAEGVTADDLRAAKLEISQAITFFSRFRKLPAKTLAAFGLKQHKLNAHVDFCLATRADTDKRLAEEDEKARKRKARPPARARRVHGA